MFLCSTNKPDNNNYDLVIKAIKINNNPKFQLESENRGEITILKKLTS